MSSTLPADDMLQFEFSDENIKKAEEILAKYPTIKKKSAVLPFLYLAQEQNNGWLSKEAMDFVAHELEIPEIKVYEVASFYTMFNLKPIGKYHIQVCGTTPCWLRGADQLHKICKEKLGLDSGQTDQQKLFTYSEVECLGACANAPVVQINDNYYEDLDQELFVKIVDDLAEGKEPKAGSQIGRVCSSPDIKI